MTAINKIRKSAFKIMHQVKSYFSNLSDALKCGWILAKLFNGVAVNIEFAKSTGELRTAKAIAIGSLSTIEKGLVRFVEMVGENTQWRSFKLERLVF